MIERFSSIKILIRIALSLLIIWGYINGISEGKAIGPYSLILIIALATINIFIKNGINKKSFSELISVLVTSLITGAIVWIICKVVKLKAFKDEIMRFNGVRTADSVAFSLYIIVTLGIFMDVVSRIVYHLDDQKDKTSDIKLIDQLKGGIEIGKRYISEKVNMIIFLVLGVSLFPICMNINNNMKFIEICKQPTIFLFLLITIVASIGVVISVPITSGVYALLNRKKTIYKTVSENKVDGKRSLKL